MFVFFPFVPLLLPGPWWEGGGRPRILAQGSFFKGQGHRGQRSNFCISVVLGPIWMKLGGCIHVDP